MTEDFDAEQFLRSLPDHLDRFYKCADELAALKEANRQWKEQDDLRKQGWATTTFEASLIQNDALRERIKHLENSIQPMVQMIADQGALSKKLYEALQEVAVMDNGLIHDVAVEAIAEYEGKERK